MQVLSKIAKYFPIYVVTTVDIVKVKGTVNESATSTMYIGVWPIAVYEICANTRCAYEFTKVRAHTL